MSISPIITRGFGSYSTVNYLPTRGYLALVVVQNIGLVELSDQSDCNVGLSAKPLYNVTLSDENLDNISMQNI
jgi:hypothetical protein